MKKCVFAGTFDPPTRGHKYITEVCSELFDEVVVAVMVNSAKTPYLSEKQRLNLLEKLFANKSNVRVICYDGAACDLLERENTPYYVRGVRDSLDFEYENRDFFASKKFKPDLIEIYIPCPQEMLHVSSTLVRNSVKFHKEYASLLPPEISEDFAKMTERKNV